MRVDIGVIVKSTEVSAVPAAAVHAKTDGENGSNCSVRVEFLHVLLRFSCPLRLQREEASYAFCCSASTPCDCSAPPLNVTV